MTRQARPSLASVRTAIVQCERCPRLRSYCIDVGRTKKASYRDQTYWAKPVPGFGDPQAQLLILGLAPAAHGANRTGRVFTGDGVGGSGDFLMATLNRAGFANIPTSHSPDDGLELSNAYIAAAVRCAPPSNKPSPEEIDTCLDHLATEVRALPRLRAVVALGQIAWDAWLKLLMREGVALPRPRPAFAHGIVCTFGTPGTFGTFGTPGTPGTPGTLGTLGTLGALGALALIGCYHPSRQNTNTGKVTPAMYDAIFGKLVRDAIG
ncbi:MAG: uracil-DNA glycosylase [Vicinamibacterales bacterium]